MATISWKSLWERSCAGTLPTYRILVPDSVSEDVRKVWRARSYRVDATEPGSQLVTAGMSRNLIRSRVKFAAATTAGAIATGIAALPTVLISVFDSVPEGGVITTGIIGTISAAGAGYTGWKYRKDPRRLDRSAKESAGAAEWITPERLGWMPGLTKGQDTDEQRLFHLTVATAQKIARTRAWTHPIMQDHVSRVDLDHAVASIGRRLVELVEIRAELEQMRQTNITAGGGTPAASSTDKQIVAYLRQLTRAFSSMVDRVLALNAYYERLRKLDQQLLMLDQTERSREIGSRVLDVISRTADDENADWRLQELNIEAEAHAESINELLRELTVTAEGFDDLDELDSKIARAQKQVDEQLSQNRAGEQLGQNREQRHLS